ncbi:hypothetical protein EV121DRAFT_211050 [Schizophyllum commune]
MDHSRILNLDILEQVFLHTLPNEIFAHPSLRVGPLLVSHVCSSWRQQVLATPALWRSLDIHVTRRGVKPSPDVIATWLGRARNRPLRIRLSLPEKPGIEGWQNSEKAFRAVIPFHMQWERLELRLRMFLPMDVLGEIPVGAMDKLRSLYITVPGTLLTAWPHLRRILDNTPNIERLGLEADLSEHLPPGSLPFAGIRILDVHNVALPVIDCLRILEAAPTLDSLMIRIAVADAAPSLPTITHPTLKLLSVYSIALDADALFDAVTLPQLIDLTIICGHRIPPETTISFFARSRCALRRLHLCTPVDDAETLVRVLEPISATLEIFHLGLLCDEAMSMDALIERLIIRDEAQEVFCPRIHSILLGPGSKVKEETASALMDTRTRTVHAGVVKLEAALVHVQTVREAPAQ